MPTDLDVRTAYDDFFDTQAIHNPDLYKWGALWVFWQAALASQAEQARKLEAEVVLLAREAVEYQAEETRLRAVIHGYFENKVTLERQLATANEVIAALQARIEAGKNQEPVGHLAEDGLFLADKLDTPRCKDMYFRPPITSERELELLAVIEQMREGITKYREADKATMECAGMILSSGRSDEAAQLMNTMFAAKNTMYHTLALTPDLSALKEHDAKVIEEIADRFDDMFAFMRKFPSTSTAESVQETLRRWAEERRKALATLVLKT